MLYIQSFLLTHFRRLNVGLVFFLSCELHVFASITLRIERSFVLCTSAMFFALLLRLCITQPQETEPSSGKSAIPSCKKDSSLITLPALKRSMRGSFI